LPFSVPIELPSLPLLVCQQQSIRLLRRHFSSLHFLLHILFLLLFHLSDEFFILTVLLLFNCATCPNRGRGTPIHWWSWISGEWTRTWLVTVQLSSAQLSLCFDCAHDRLFPLRFVDLWQMPMTETLELETIPAINEVYGWHLQNFIALNPKFCECWHPYFAFGPTRHHTNFSTDVSLHVDSELAEKLHV
jgi:hypothetical protein